jgi:microcystin-dependent protein
MADRRRNLGIPSGVVFPFAGTVAPYGYLICDGSPILKSEYPQLFLSIGFSHGDGSQNSDGTASGFTSTTHFNLPDYRGRFLRGVDGLAGNDPDKLTRLASKTGGTSGNNVGSVQQDAMQGHWHNIDGGVNSADDPGGPENSLTASAGGTVAINSTLKSQNYIRDAKTDSVNGTPRTSSESRPKNANVNYIIKI